jgi:translation initiation factor 2A
MVADPSAPNDAVPAPRVMCYSKDGSLFAYHDGTEIKVVSTETGEVLCKVQRPKTLALCFSPGGSQLAAWENYSVRKVHGGAAADQPAPPPQGGEPNLTVWSPKTGEMLTGYINRGFDSWQPQWTDNDQWCCRLGNNEVHFYDASDYTKGVVKRVAVKGITKFSLAPGDGPARLATFVPVVKGAPAQCALYREPGLERPLAFKSFYKVRVVLFFLLVRVYSCVCACVVWLY